MTGNSVPDGLGGLLVTVHHTCLTGQTDPMAIMDVDVATGEPLWQIAAAGVQNGNSIVYCYPDTIKELEPQMAVRGDGAVVVAAMTNNGLPPLTVLTSNGFAVWSRDRFSVESTRPSYRSGDGDRAWFVS